MRVVIQRVKKASVSIDNEQVSSINNGLLILCGFENNDESKDIEWIIKKISQLRIFNDNNNQMNLSLFDVEGEVLIVSQFTLHAKTKKGNRPSYIHAAKPEIAIPLYNEFIKKFNNLIPNKVKSGKFGTDMQVELINDGPVTIIIDTKNKE
jgi:D-tyrosyl-tRNA(Tyr) deacylase